MKKPIIVITGPTASGKTALSLIVAKKFKAEIICADSMTVFRGMDIGTDKPTTNKKLLKRKDGSYIINGISHHLLDELNPDQEFNVSIFKELADEKIKNIHKRGNIPILVGGSTMYIDATVYQYEIPKVKPDFDLRNELEKKSNEELFSELVELDPDCEWTIDRHNKRRIIRALEVIKKTGQPFCGQRTKSILPDNVLYLAVERDRSELYLDINRRVDEMMKIGFLKEVESLFVKYDHNTAMQAAGYKQLTKYLDGTMELEEAIEKTKQVHRNYAKRQMTWLRRNKDIIWVDNNKHAEEEIKNFLNKIK